VRIERKKRTREKTNWVGRKETSSLKRALAIATLEDIDGFGVICENYERTKPCANELTEDVGNSLEPWKPSKNGHAECHLEDGMKSISGSACLRCN
jgi:hypothetical protein